jgi:DNA-binding CsgD family transcriptional regulator
MSSQLGKNLIITSSILLLKELTDTEKIVCSLINTTANIDGCCYLNNKELAECLCKSEESIQATLKRLYSKSAIENIGNKKDRKLKLSFLI